MRATKAIDFAVYDDARDYLVEHGFYQFAGRTFQHRYSGKTAHITRLNDGSASVTIF